MDPQFIKDMPKEYYHGYASYFGGNTGFYNHYYNTHPTMEKKMGIPEVVKDPLIEMDTQIGMDVKAEIEIPDYNGKTVFNIMEGIEYRNFDPNRQLQESQS
jgi:hypothetical protein